MSTSTANESPATASSCARWSAPRGPPAAAAARAAGRQEDVLRYLALLLGDPRWTTSSTGCSARDDEEDPETGGRRAHGCRFDDLVLLEPLVRAAARGDDSLFAGPSAPRGPDGPERRAAAADARVPRAVARRVGGKPTMTRATRPDVERELEGLKDFQRRTVDRVHERLWDADDPTRRFLVADEVGLGKTLVARGVIAKTIDHLWDTRRPDRRRLHLLQRTDRSPEPTRSFASVRTPTSGTTPTGSRCSPPSCATSRAASSTSSPSPRARRSTSPTAAGTPASGCCSTGCSRRRGAARSARGRGCGSSEGCVER